MSASFFNVGGVGIGLNASGTHSTTERTELQTSESTNTSLGKEYSITGKINIPAGTGLAVTITTYSVNFKTSDITIGITAPSSASLKVQLSNACCCRSRYCFVTAEDFLRSIYGAQANISRAGGLVSVEGFSEITYLGEKTIVTKEAIQAS